MTTSFFNTRRRSGKAHAFVNGDFEAERVPDRKPDDTSGGIPWYIYDPGITGWSGRVELQRFGDFATGNQVVELDAGCHQIYTLPPTGTCTGHHVTLTSNPMVFHTDQPYTMTFDSWNRTEYAEDNMIAVTVPGKITHINKIPVWQYGSNLTTAISSQQYSNRNDQFALMYLSGSTITFSAGGTTYRYVDSYGEIQEITGVHPHHIDSITFIPASTSGSVTFADASTDDVVVAQGPYLDNVKVFLTGVIADLDIDSNNDGGITPHDHFVKMDGDGHIAIVGQKIDFEDNSYIDPFFNSGQAYEKRIVSDKPDVVSAIFQNGAWLLTALKPGTALLTMQYYAPGNTSGGEVVVSKSTSKATVIPMVSVKTTNATATERLPDVAQDYGEFTFKREKASGQTSGTPVNTSQALTVAFVMFYDKNAKGEYHAEPGVDYTLEYYDETSKKWVKMTTPSGNKGVGVGGSGSALRYRYTVVIPEGEESVKVRLVPIFDWEDEGVKFNPFIHSDPSAQTGEFANLEIVEVTWPGKSSGSASSLGIVDGSKTGKVEIKDGAILEIYFDYDEKGKTGSGEIGASDVEKSLKNTPFFLDWNTDDDNKNGIIDCREGVGEYWYSGYAGVIGENDLRRAAVYAWVGDLKSVKNGVADYNFEVYQEHPTGNPVSVRLWQDEIKSDLLPKHSNLPQTYMGIITQTNKTVFVGFWMERFAPGEVLLNAKAECYQGLVREAAYDGTESALIAYFDVAIDSDNNGTIDYSDLENFLEAHEYGLGKIINWAKDSDLYSSITNQGIIDKLVPIVITLPSYVYEDKDKYYISFSFGPLSSLSFFDNTYTKRCYSVTDENAFIPLDMINWDNDRSITLYVIGEVFNPMYGGATYKNVNDTGRQTQSFEIILNSKEQANITSDKVQVILQNNEDAFFQELQTNDDLRYAIAASKIYGRNDAKNFCLQLLDEEYLKGLGITDTRILSYLTQSQNDGFNVGIYRDYITLEYILAYQGTDAGVKGLPDWVANLSSASGSATGQYIKAINVARYITGDHLSPFEENRPGFEKLNKNIKLVGHSLGGGLASAASVISLLPAVTFNAAGINQFFLRNIVDDICGSMGSSNITDPIIERLENRCIAFATNQINRITTKWDILTLAQQYLAIVPSAVGNPYKVALHSQYDTIIETRDYWGWGSSIESRFIRSLERLNKALPGITSSTWYTTFKNSWNTFIAYRNSHYPILCHGMDQIIFGLLENNGKANLFGYPPQS